MEHKRISFKHCQPVSQTAYTLSIPIDVAIMLVPSPALISLSFCKQGLGTMCIKAEDREHHKIFKDGPAVFTVSCKRNDKQSAFLKERYVTNSRGISITYMTLEQCVVDIQQESSCNGQFEFPYEVQTTLESLTHTFVISWFQLN